MAECIDVHTHVYIPRYFKILRSREKVPYIRRYGDEERILLFDGEDSATGAQGRPVDESYWSIEQKLAFMKQSNITASVISIANPWLDFLPPTDAPELARQLNDDLDVGCDDHPGRLYGFGVLPISAGRDAVIAELMNIKGKKNLRGAIFGTSGLGNGLDDPELSFVFKAASDLGLTLFLHPHYGVGSHDSFEGPSLGHALTLALGFPFETATAVSRLVVSGGLAQFDNLKLLLAHSGGVLPFLAGRLDSCAVTDRAVKLPEAPSFYLKRILYDAVNYHAPAMNCTAQFVGAGNMFFGTDHPFSIGQSLACSLLLLPSCGCF
jgi:aminocarboxymuconate-semialdehyde decarboxylase